MGQSPSAPSTPRLRRLPPHRLNGMKIRAEMTLRGFAKVGRVMTMKALTQRDYLRVGEAASFLGVPEGTLRNWDRALKPVRHPINGYRLYPRD